VSGAVQDALLVRFLPVDGFPRGLTFFITDIKIFHGLLPFCFGRRPSAFRIGLLLREWEQALLCLLYQKKRRWEEPICRRRK
jgi:hypothetical protein